MVNHGLSPHQLNILRNILAPYADQIDRVCLFGSRATGAAQPWSDVDLVLYGPVREETVDRLGTAFMESLLSVEVDIQAYNAITYPPLKAHIDQASVELFDREQLRAVSGDALQLGSWQ